MTKIYFYKLVVDDGGAPCVEKALLSLAICKPAIRRTAETGNLIFGFAANSLDRDNRLIYVARVTRKLTDGRYFDDPVYRDRADCIYERKGPEFVWRKRSWYHGPDHIHHDLGKSPNYSNANVLLSSDFRYFGKSGSAEYKRKYPTIGLAVDALGRGHRVKHTPLLYKEFTQLADDLWKCWPRKVLGEASSSPRAGRSHRGGSCGTIGPC